MPSAKRVVSVRLDEGQYEALSRFSAAMGQSRGSLLVEMLDQMVPVWDRLGKAIEAAKIAEKGAREGWRHGVLCQLDDLGMQAENLKDEALQLIVKSLGHFESAVRAAGGGGESLPATDAPPASRAAGAKPPYL